MDDKEKKPDPLIEKLGSSEPKTADGATTTIFRLEEKAFPLLLTAKGNDAPFRGTMLANPKSSILIPLPMEGFEIPPGHKYKVVTVEVAALYLISAIYYDNLHFTRAPQLVNIDVEPSERTVDNTPERIRSAFESGQSWVAKAIRLTGRKEIREKMPPPFHDVNLGWN